MSVASGAATGFSVGGPWGAVAGGIAGGIFGAGKGKEAKALSDREAELRWMATQEQVRKMKLQHDEIIGQAKADVGASGFTAGSTSHTEAISQAESEFQRERDLTLMMGEEARRLGLKTGEMTESSMVKQGIMGGMSLGDTAQGWFK